MKHLALALMLALVVAPFAPVWAVQPDEVLEDPALEARARELSKGLRCLVCRNENIDDSNAELARDLRLLVRERLVEGDSDEEVIGFVVDRYGEYVLLNPVAAGINWLLYAAGPLLLLAGLGIGFTYLRGRQSAPEPVSGSALSDDERKRLDDILGQ